MQNVCCAHCLFRLGSERELAERYDRRKKKKFKEIKIEKIKRNIRHSDNTEYIAF